MKFNSQICTTKEIWKDIKGYEGLYQVSNLGNVRSYHSGEWRLLTNVINSRGYKQYLLYKNGKRKNMRGNRPVCMFDVNGDFIREFYNINDAAKFVKGVHTCILRCCGNEVFCYKGYIWRYKEDINSIVDAVAAYKTSKNTNRKVEVNIDGQKEVFNSISEASRALGISRRTIRKYNSKNNIKWELI